MHASAPANTELNLQAEVCSMLGVHIPIAHSCQYLYFAYVLPGWAPMLGLLDHIEIPPGS